MDLLDFDPEELYFEQEDTLEVQALINQAGSLYEDGDAELPLLQAFMRTPDSLNVLVALNRFYYYQHRLDEALLVSERALNIINAKLPFTNDWQILALEDISSTPKESLSWVRLYLFTLKSIGFLKMRLHDLETSKAIFEKLVSLDSENRIGAVGLLEIVTRKIDENNHIFQLYK
ncbi:hypothetical protein AU255_15065 [Methyloprofundus sedimenti]|uniref:Tetratricopeptide repeat protein n=1 Tax=Methyloprofundus sedimenti TaxID=1420851 RepID=A0A1V8M1W9_9GAMM|nr:hypothetical protein [Methyloprofundus sedimenti]OQK15545.1 hypothetical protein AU255_15065 [Methyloprofundus sedimenti]